MRSRPVVVGFDGSPSSEAALGWGAAEAVLRGVPLRVVRAVEYDAGLLGSMSTAGAAALAEVLRSHHDAAETEKAVAGVREAHPGLDVKGLHPLGTAVQALLGLQDEAGLIVLGSGGKGLARQVFLGSTSLTVAAVASVPVVVVGPHFDAQREPTGTVIIAVDGSHHAVAAAEWAFAEAAARGSRLTVVNTWGIEVVDGYVVTEPESPEWQAIERRQRDMVDGTIAGLRENHPDVEVEVVIAHGPAASTLQGLAESADLVVMGSRGRGGIKGQLLGSVSQRVLRAAVCPVAIVKPS